MNILNTETKKIQEILGILGLELLQKTILNFQNKNLWFKISMHSSKSIIEVVLI